MVNYTPWVSIIIPAFNSGSTIENCISSVLNQTLRNLEVVVVDDCSKDDTSVRVNQIAEKDGRIVLYRNSINKGAGYCRNLGLEKSKGEYIYFLDSDDFIPGDDILKTLYLAAIKKEANIIGGKVHKGISANNIKCAKEGTVFSKKTFRDAPFDGGFYAFLYKKVFLNDNCIKFPYYSNFEDPVFLIRAMQLAQTYYSCNEITYLYTRVKKRNITKGELIDRVRAVHDILSVAGNLRKINYLMGKNLLDIINHSGEIRFIFFKRPCEILSSVILIKPNYEMPVKLSRAKLMYCLLRGILKNG